MVEYNNPKEQQLSELLKAISDPTRRSLLTELCQQGASRVTDLASLYDMSLNAISKHIKVLEKGKLIKRRTVGRVHWIEADFSQVKIIEDWLDQLQSIWSMRLDNLNEVINNE